MKKTAYASIAAITALCFSVNASAVNPDSDIDLSKSDIENGIYTIPCLENTVILHDLDDSLTRDEEAEVINNLCTTSKFIDASVAIVITDDIGSDKSDYGVMDYADVYYEKYCGMDTDGILLLLNNDTNYDWISTSGECIQRFEYSIDALFDSYWSAIESGDYFNSCIYFSAGVNYYYSTPITYDDYEGDYYTDDYYYDSEYTYDSDYESDIGDLFGSLYVAVIIIAVIFIVLGTTVKSKYTLKKNQTAVTYELKNSLVFTQQTDTFLRTYTTRAKAYSSSSGSSHRSGSRRSGGSHRSSGGGRHGGGGRRR